MGYAYSLPTGAYGGFSFYYGSGLYSSTDTIYGPVYGTSGSRQSISELNVRVGSGPKYGAHHLGVTLGIENLLDDRGLLDLRSGTAGTRYEMGRRVTLGLTGKF
jgi:hypothetical protein